MGLSRRHWKTRASLPHFPSVASQQSPLANSNTLNKSPPLTSSPLSDCRPRRVGRPPKRRFFQPRREEGTPGSKEISQQADNSNPRVLLSPSLELSQDAARTTSPLSPPQPGFTRTRSRTASLAPPRLPLPKADEDEDNEEEEELEDSSESQDSRRHGYGRVRRLKRKLVRKHSRSVRMAAHMRRITRSSDAQPVRRSSRVLQSQDDATDDQAGAKREHSPPPPAAATAKNGLDRDDSAMVYSLRPRRASVPSPQSGSPPRLRKRVRLEEPLYSSNGTKREDEEADEDDDNVGQRRYPMRNRRHTDVYQVECHPHGHPRDWFAGTGYKERRRSRRRRRRRRDSRSIWPRAHDESSTSSSSCSSDSSSFGEAGLHKGRFSPAVSNAAGLVDMDELRFERRRSKSLLHSRNELMPINIKLKDLESGPLRDRLVAGTALTDIEPMAMDTNVTFEDVGGLQAQIRSLQESVLLPLVYPEVFEGFGIEPPRGVLFYGPPGTGKTLLARALANECTRMASAAAGPTQLTSTGQTARPVAFFMRKGADCLSKWVGESERQLRLLFDQAYRMRPSIIFFDEIDGLAPVRSSRQDQIHSSIVSTLLSLMDGLDRRAEVVVIGATNRPDAIDPALRRPGRFDREFCFSLPNEPVRRRILEIHTAKWKPPPSAELLGELARLTVGYCGADLKGLATEACLCCLRRQYPQVYRSKLKLKLDISYLVVDRSDWLLALRHIRPASLRAELDVGSAASPSAVALASTSRRALPSDADAPQGPLQVLLAPLVDQLATRITRALLGRNRPPPPPPQQPSTVVVAAATPRSAPADLDGSGGVWPASAGDYADEERETAAATAVGQNEGDAVCHRTHSALLFTLSLATSPVLIKQLLVDDSLHPAVFPAVWRRLESVEVFTINLASLFAASASGDSCVVTSISQILGAAQRALANQHELDPADEGLAEGEGTTGASAAANTTLGVVLFIPRIDRLFTRLPSLAAFYLIDRLIELTASNSGSQIVCDFGGNSPSRRLILVATFRWPRNPPTMSSDTVLSSVSKTSPLTIRLPQSALSPRSHPQSGGSVVCNGHASPRVIARIRQQQQTVELPSGGGGRHRKLPSLKPAPPPPFTLPSSDWLSPVLDASAQPTSTPGSPFSPQRSLPAFMRPLLSRTALSLRPPPLLFSSSSSATATEGAALDEEPESPRRSSCSTTDASAAYMRHLFRFPYVELISFEPPPDAQRAVYFRPIFFDWLLETTLKRKSTEEKRPEPRRPPTPQPICSESNSAAADALANRSLSQAEIAELRHQHETLQRQLRVVMRRVVAQLARDRRFTVFTRPVQADEAPDYLEVISQPMDLGVVRDKIDAREYSTVDVFKADLKLIYSNALEYNPPNVPRSREIRARAFEFWDAIEIILAEELNPPDLDDLCAAAAKAVELYASQQHQHTETHVGNTATLESSNKPPPLPLPLGSRYSRRLHGEQPILDDDDVYQLLNPRQRHMSPTKPTRPTTSSADSILKPNPAEENTEISEGVASVEHPVAAAQSSRVSEVSPSQQKTMVSPSGVRSRRASRSTADHEVSGLLETSSGTAANDLLLAAATAAMQSQLEKTCLATRGWSVDQLISLHCDLSHVLNGVQLLPTLDLPSLITCLSRVLSRHQEIVSRITYDEFDTSPVPCSSPPLLQ